jgi:PAS domain S-box-containing protein
MPTRLVGGDRKRKRASRAAKAADRKNSSAAHPAHKKRRSTPNPSVRHGNFELLFSSNPYPTFVFDRASLAFLDVNAAAEAAYGYSREEFLRMRITDIRPEEDIPCFLQLARTQEKSGQAQGCRRHRRKNGDFFDAEVTAKAISFKGKKAVLAVIQDVTARRSAERQNARHTAYLQALTENNPSAIVAIDLQRRVQMCNPAFERMFGYSLDEARGRTLESLVALPGCEVETLGLVDSIARDGGICVATKRRRRDGAVIDVRITGVPLVINGEGMLRHLRGHNGAEPRGTSAAYC